MTRQASREGHERAPGLISRLASTPSLLQPYVPGRRPTARAQAHAHSRNLAAQTWHTPPGPGDTSTSELAVLLERLASMPDLGEALHVIATELPRVLDLTRVVVALDNPPAAMDSRAPARKEPERDTPPVSIARVTRPLWLLPRQPAASGDTFETPIEAHRERLGLLRAWVAPGDTRGPETLLPLLRIVCTALGQQIMLCRSRVAEPEGPDASSGAPTPGERQRWNALLGYVAHEVKTPLTCIQGHAQLLSRYVRAARATTKTKRGTLARLLDDCERHLPALEKQVARIDQLLRDTLDVAQSADGRLVLAQARVDLAALVSEVAQRFTADGAPFIAVDASQAVWVACDAARIERVIGDLLRAAFAASDGDREYTVHVQVTASTDGDTRVARVVIEAPWTPKRDTLKTTGPVSAILGTDSAASLPDLRLALSAAILRQHGGALHMTSNGTGGKAIVLLPLLETHVAETGETHGAPDPHRR